MPSSQRLLRLTANRSITPLPTQLEVAPLQGISEQILFANLYNKFVKPHYLDSEDYASFVLSIHNQRRDRLGYLSKAKTIWSLLHNREPLGFTVVTEKRGGSIKFGPTVLRPTAQGQQMGTAFRILVEQRYPNARKAYNTLPDYNWAALRYVLQAGYRVEAHLRDQYRVGTGEFVVGKVLRPTTYSIKSDYSGYVDGCIVIRDSSFLPPSVICSLAEKFLAKQYDEIDSNFVESLLLATQAPPQFSSKFKKVLVALRGGEPIGLIIATPKRGGALKCSPLAVQAEDVDSMRRLLASAVESFPDKALRKVYLHIPLSSHWMVDTALSLGFLVEGVLREPYREGLDFAVLGRLL